MGHFLGIKMIRCGKHWRTVVCAGQDVGPNMPTERVFPVRRCALKLPGGQQPHLGPHLCSAQWHELPQSHPWQRLGIFEGLAGRPGPLCAVVSLSKEKRGRAGCSVEIEDVLGLLSHITAVGGLHGCCLWTKSYGGSQFCHSALLAFWRCREQDAELLLPWKPRWVVLRLRAW